MPNWAKGEMRVRGTEQNIKRFLLEGLEEIIPNTHVKTKKIEVTEWGTVECECRLYLFESGVQYNQDIEVIDGEITKDKVIEFDNYLWDCIAPNIGG